MNVRFIFASKSLLKFHQLPHGTKHIPLCPCSPEISYHATKSRSRKGLGQGLVLEWSLILGCVLQRGLISYTLVLAVNTFNSFTWKIPLLELDEWNWWHFLLYYRAMKLFSSRLPLTKGGYLLLTGSHHTATGTPSSPFTPSPSWWYSMMGSPL